jgi:hypothetical protein
MSIKTTGIWIASVIAAGAIGWYAAMEVNRGPAFKDEQDAYERFSNAMTLTDSMEREEVVAKLVRRLTPETLPGAIRALQDDVVDVYNNDLRMIMWYWAQQDPRGMLQTLGTWPEVRVQRMAAGEAVAAVLRKEGYDAAHALFEELPTHQRDAAIPSLVLAYLETGSTPNLIELIESYQSRDERDLVAGIVVGQILYLNGPQALADWVESLPAGQGSKNDLKPVAFRAAQTELLRRDKLEFLETWLDKIADEPWAAGARRGVAVNLVKREPLKAIEWVQKLTPEQGHDEILAETLRGFASYDRIGALEWLRQQKDDPQFDAGFARLSYEFARRDPSISIELADRVHSPEMFEHLCKSLALEWKDLGEDIRPKWMGKLDELEARHAAMAKATPAKAAAPTAAAAPAASAASAAKKP